MPWANPQRDYYTEAIEHHPCPYCRAQPGEQCRPSDPTSENKRAFPHEPRIRLAKVFDLLTWED